MSFTQLIKDSDSVFSAYHVIVLQAADYPALFMRALLAKIARESVIKPMTIDLATADLKQVQLQLSTSFLGQRCRYWLGNLNQLSAKNVTTLTKFLSNYQAEHTILVGSANVITGPGVITIPCPATVDKKLMCELFALYSTAEQQRCALMARDIFMHIQTTSLEQAIQILNYASVLGANRALFIDQWFDKIVKQENSLFQLSGLLLAQNNNFWPLWARVHDSYEFPFWLAYFSELFFRANFYILYRKQQKLAEAKKIGFRLPFSFLQRDWQRIEPLALQQTHQRLTDIDYQLKNGASPTTLDSLFTTWLAK